VSGLHLCADDIFKCNHKKKKQTNKKTKKNPNKTTTTTNKRSKDHIAYTSHLDLVVHYIIVISDKLFAYPFSHEEILI
jgi:hypothetical protein